MRGPVSMGGAALHPAGKPAQTLIESVYGKLRDEYLDQHWFLT